MRYAAELADNLTPEALFQRRWAVTVLEATMAALRQEYATAGKRALFEDLQGFLPVMQCVLSKRYGFAGLSINTGADVVTPKTIKALVPLIEKGIR